MMIRLLRRMLFLTTSYNHSPDLHAFPCGRNAQIFLRCHWTSLLFLEGIVNDAEPVVRLTWIKP
jgi:hypothetical protein